MVIQFSENLQMKGTIPVQNVNIKVYKISDTKLSKFILRRDGQTFGKISCKISRKFRNLIKMARSI